MLTEFGKLIRKLRIDRGELIKDMAEKLDVTASYVSAVENGKRNIPNSWGDEITKLYGLGEKERLELSEAIIHSAKTVKFSVGKASGGKKETAILFAREFDALDESDANQLSELLQNLLARKRGR